MNRSRSILGQLALGGALLLACGTTSLAQTPGTQPLRIYAAGSLAASFNALLTAFGASPGAGSSPTYGPAGTLRERLEHGEAADLFASADMT